MRNEIKLPGLVITMMGVLLVSGASMHAMAQNPSPQTQSDSTQTPPAQSNQIPNLEPLNLTQDQIKQIRMINAGMKDERQAAGRRLTQAQRALTEAIESPNQDQALIAQRSHDVADAREALIRLRATAEARIIHEVLTPEQRAKVKEIRERNQALGRRDNQQLGGVGPGRRQGLPRNANAAAPLGPKQRRAGRQQSPPLTKP
jgi:Spy/CpxP family protein refolding chaperone